ncbi:MAG: UPF0489 family protein [Eubacterium sp.]
MMEEQHLRTVTIGNKPLFIVDNHQYVLPLWARASLASEQSYTLVSIDYHPDTNPPFWLYAYQKAMAIDPEREEELVDLFKHRKLYQIDKNHLETLEMQMPFMRNDEHINTAMELGYLSDYHMINCMEKHVYKTGHHYLMEKEDFGKITDTALKRSGFSLEVLKKNHLEYQPFILDIDLDYFRAQADVKMISQEMKSIKELVLNAAFITCARSVTYFDHLKCEKFDIKDCEEGFIHLLKRLS